MQSNIKTAIGTVPSWTDAGVLLSAAIRAGTEEGREIAATEVQRICTLLEYLQEQEQEREQENEVQRICTLLEHLQEQKKTKQGGSYNYTPEQLDYITLNVPDGYDTVLGFTAKHAPELLPYDCCVPETTQRDGWWLKHQCEMRGRSYFKVNAPTAMALYDIEEVNAYPVDLLAERIL